MNAETIKIDAATIVILARIDAEPRGPKEVLETLLVKRAPALVFPGWSSTATTSTMQERKNNVYRT